MLFLYHSLLVILSFSLTKDDVKRISEDLGIARNGELIFYGVGEPMGVGGIVIGSDYDDYAFRFNDNVSVCNDGHPEEDVLLSLEEVNCNVYEWTCSPRT